MLIAQPDEAAATVLMRLLPQCHEVTEEVEKLLGKVVYTTPTAERFEEKTTIANTVTETQGSQDSTQKWGKY